MKEVSSQKSICNSCPSFSQQKGLKISLMCGSYHIGIISIGIEYRNLHGTLDVYLLFGILLGQIKSKINYRLVTYKLASP